METSTAKWSWQKSYKKETSPEIRNKIRTKIKKMLETKEGLNTSFLWDILKTEKHFIGVIPQDYLSSLHVLSFPIKFVVNLDLSSQSGSHWIGIYITKDTLEIYDSLGMKTNYWKHFPKFLLRFVKQFSKSHRIFVTPELQNPNSGFCGLYCYYFLVCRPFLSFLNCLSLFTSDFTLNDSVLLDFLMN